MGSYSDDMSSRYMGDDSTGAKLTRLMADKGVSKNRLAAESGVSKSTIRRMCSGHRVGTFDSWARVLTALGADANEFMESDGELWRGDEDGQEQR